jgi:hypothetical protein
LNLHQKKCKECMGRNIYRVRENQVTEESVEIYQVGIEPVQVCTKELHIEFNKKQSH